MSKRNIVFIHTDSMDGRIMGCMGHPAMESATPNLDRLAKQGGLFRNSYCNNPICCPSRASMWSGQYSHHCEGWNNYKGLSKSDPTFLTHLTNAGYTPRILGKTDYLSGHHTIRARVSPWTRSANIRRPNYRMSPPRIIDEDREQVHKRDWKDTDEAIAWLQEISHGDEPFFLYLGIRSPHPSFTTSRRYLDMIPESVVSIPKPDETSHPVIEYQRINKNWLHGFSDEMVRKVRRIYFAMIAEVDAMVGKVLETIEDLNLNESTYVIFSSDHGEMAMEHQQFYKMSPYEPSVHIPLIINGPDVQKGKQIESLVSLVDIYPTLMDMASIQHPDGLDGYSLMPELTGCPSQRPDWVLSEFHGTSCNTGVFMLRQGYWKYIVYVGYKPQLFNLKDDPDEIRNLAQGRPDIVKKMEELLQQIVDYEAVDAKVKAYDKASFRQWRKEQITAGTYYQTMSRIFSGWSNLSDDDIQLWTEEDEKMLMNWLNK